VNKIINPKSCYFNNNCRIVKNLPEQQIEILVDIGEEDEILIVVSSSDIDLKRTLVKPKSRKDFYCFAKEPNSSRGDIKNTLEYMISTGIIKTQNPEKILSFFDDLEKDSETLVDEFRDQRNQGLFEFNLPNVAQQDQRPKGKFSPHSR
jgi:hypothetical protein